MLTALCAEELLSLSVSMRLWVVELLWGSPQPTGTHFTETNVESGTSQRKSGTSVNLSDSGKRRQGPMVSVLYEEDTPMSGVGTPHPKP